MTPGTAESCQVAPWTLNAKGERFAVVGDPAFTPQSGGYTPIRCRNCFGAIGRDHGSWVHEALFERRDGTTVWRPVTRACREGLGEARA